MTSVLSLLEQDHRKRKRTVYVRILEPGIKTRNDDVQRCLPCRIRQSHSRKNIIHHWLRAGYSRVIVIAMCIDESQW